MGIKMTKACDNTSVGQIIRNGNRIVVIERRNYPEAFALPAGHVDKDTTFADAVARETKEEVGVSIIENKLIFSEDIDNPCKREDGTHHFWEVYEATEWQGELKAGSDAKAYRWVMLAELQQMAKRTEYFIKKYNVPYTEIGKLTTVIFGNDPVQKNTDREWREQMGLEPVWYYILKKIGLI